MNKRVMVCGVDCHPGDENCNNYCNNDKSRPMADYPPEATSETQPPKETGGDREKIDAARYRWLRRQPWVKVPGLHAWGADLDKAIDAARNDAPVPANAKVTGAEGVRVD